MDHDHAIEIEASMKYALGELTAQQRDSFEEHFADCSHCLREVETAAAFVANARAVLQERAAPRLADASIQAAKHPKRFAWLMGRPVLAFSAALNLLLAAGVGYAVLRHGAAPAGNVASSPAVVEFAEVHGTTRGAAQVVRTPGRPVVLSFDLPEHYDRYLYSLTQSGAFVDSGEVSAPAASESLNLEIPAAGLKPGEYQVTLTGKTNSKEDLLGSCKLVVYKQ